MGKYSTKIHTLICASLSSRNNKRLSYWLPALRISVPEHQTFQDQCKRYTSIATRRRVIKTPRWLKTYKGFFHHNRRNLWNGINTKILKPAKYVIIQVKFQELTLKMFISTDFRDLSDLVCYTVLQTSIPG